MKSLIENLVKVDKNETLQILNKLVSKKININFKTITSEKIFTTTLQKNPVRKIYYIANDSLRFDPDLEVTIKVIIDQRLFFLKTFIRQANQKFYFDALDEMFEVARRKKFRYSIPESWSQSAHLQGASNPIQFKSSAKILDMSKAGVRIKIETDLPKYEINQVVNFYFRVHRRAEILVKSKVIYVKKNRDSGSTLGIEFSDNSILIANKIQNVCDDLAFYHAHESKLDKHNL